MMIKKLIIVLAAICATGFSFAKTSVSTDERALSLDGDWSFALPAAKAAGQWDKLPVPASWNTFTEYADYLGDAWYQRELKVPRQWKGQRIYLKFDAVYDIADVWYNDTYLGQHVGGYTPFEFDLTELAKPGSKGTLTLKVNNEHKVGAWFQWGGINRSVHLFARSDLRLIRQKVEPVLDLETGTAMVKLIVTVANAGDVSASFVAASQIDEVPDTGFRITGAVTAGETATFESQIMLNTEQTRQWHFDDPQLYHLKTTLSDDEEIVDSLQDRFGIRKVDIKPDGLYLNGEKVRLMGYNRVHDHRAYGNTEPVHLVRSDIDLMKRSGANFSRIMHAPNAPDLLDYCDEAGYMIWSEIPMWQMVYRAPMGTAEEVNQAPDGFPGNAMREMIQRDWNHPSIIGWSPGNELRQEAALYVEAMRPLSKSLDETRFYANIHDQGFQESAQGGYKGVGASNVDVLMMNKYRDIDTKIQAVLDQHASIPNLPIFYSEFGQTRDESLNQTFDFTRLWERLGQEPYVIGGAHWTFNDYRSYHKGTPASQNRDWGIVDIWRNPKTFFYDMSKMQQPVHSISVTHTGNEGTVVIHPRAKLEIPSFTLRGYKWAHELLAQNGDVLEGALHELETIEPDSDPIETKISWSTKQAKRLIVSLITPNGYTVAELRYDLATGAMVPTPTFAEPLNPEVRKVLPLDGSFMIGVTNLEGDTGLEVAYGTRAGQHSQTLRASAMGAIRVRGLENGTTYYGKVRRLLETGEGPWSPEFTVTPDGGLRPDPPVIKGVVRGENALAVRIEFPEKVSAYEVTLSSGEVIVIHRSKPGLLMLPVDSERLAIVGEYGVSKAVSL